MVINDLNGVSKKNNKLNKINQNLDLFEHKNKINQKLRQKKYFKLI